MKALLRKDLYVLATTFKTTLLMWMVFPLVALFSPQNASFILYTGLIAGTISSTLISYEEREKWPMFAGTLPVSKKQVVTERYVFTLIMILAATLIGAVIFITYVLRGAPEYASPALLVQNFATSLLMPSLLLPVTYRYGIEKGRYVVMFVVIFVAIGSQQMVPFFNNISNLANYLVPLMVIGSIALFAVSYALSVKWYTAKESH